LEEQLAVAQLHRIHIRVRATQGTGRFVQHVALKSIGTAMSKDSGRLVWQMFGGENYFVLDLNFVTHMITMLDLFNLPNFICHVGLPPLIYKD